MSRRGLVLFLLMSLVWGIPYLLIRVAVRDVAPPTLVFLRTAPAALLLLPLAVRGGSLRAVLARWRWVLAYTVVELAVPWLALSRAEQRLDSSASGLLVAGTPLVAAVLYPLVTRRSHFGRRRTAGLLVGLVGVAALVGLDLRGADLGAVAEVGVTAAGYAAGPLIINRRLGDLPGLGVVTASLLLTAVAYAPVALTDLPDHLRAEAVASVAVLAVVCTALAFVLFFELVGEIGPARSVVITYLNPAVAVLLGIAFLHEPFSAGIAVGFPLIIAGSVLATVGGAGDGSAELALPGAPDGGHLAAERLVDGDHRAVGPSVPGDDGRGAR
ncbi:MAG: DMT family transporter [Acidimicrobiales bacterium]